MDPAEQTKLLPEVTTLEGHDKAHETKNIERETDKTMAHRESGQLCIGEYNMLECVASAKCRKYDMRLTLK